MFTSKEQQPLRWAANAIARSLKLGSKQQACVAIAKSNTRLTYSEWELLCELPRTARTRVKHFGTEVGRQKSLARAQLVAAPSHKRAVARNDNTIVYSENTILAIEKKYTSCGCMYIA